MRTEAGRLYVAPGSSLDIYRDGGRTRVTLTRGAAELERAGSTFPLEIGDETMLDGDLFAGGAGDGDSIRRPLETGQPNTTDAREPEGEGEVPPLAELRRAAIFGRVKDIDGAPIGKFRVLMLLDREVPEVDFPKVREYTAEDGTFVWDDLEPDRYEVFLEAPGFGQHRRRRANARGSGTGGTRHHASRGAPASGVGA